MAAILHALPFLAIGLFVAFMFYGFWRGLSLRPNDVRVSNRVQWWWGMRN
jgi:hypothetical protein